MAHGAIGTSNADFRVAGGSYHKGAVESAPDLTKNRSISVEGPIRWC